MQFQPPTNSGWGQPYPDQQQPFPQQPSMYMPIPPVYTQPETYQQIPQQPGLPPALPGKKHLNRANFYFIFSVVCLAILFGAYLFLHSYFGGDTSSNTSHNAGMTEQQYKASTSTITVADLDKDGNTTTGGDVHFTATILAFVKDSNGNTAGTNVTDPGSFSSIIQVIFPAGTDITQLNAQDTIEVWGTDEGVFSGANAFGATVHAVAVQALYLTDQTTNYSTN